LGYPEEEEKEEKNIREKINPLSDAVKTTAPM
jgi:hypothetical protein